MGRTSSAEVEDWTYSVVRRETCGCSFVSEESMMSMFLPEVTLSSSVGRGRPAVCTLLSRQRI